MELLIILLMVWAAFGALGYYIAVQKGRPEAEGLLLGFLFGPLGVLLVALLPSVHSSRGSRSQRGRDRVAWMPDYREDWDQPPDAPKSDPIEDEVLGFLNDELGGKPQEKIDMEAIARAARPRTGLKSHFCIMNTDHGARSKTRDKEEAALRGSGWRGAFW
jgi:hypothetical protein